MTIYGVERDPEVVQGPAFGVPEAPTPPSVLASIGAAFRQNNALVSYIADQRNHNFPPEAGYNPIEDIKDTPYFPNHLNTFASSRSRAETQSIMRQINQENADRRTTASGNTFGTIMDLIAGGLDPTNLLSIPLPPVRGGLLARSAFLRGARDVGAAVATGTAAQELALSASQQERTAKESLEGIATATMLWGFIGGGAYKLLGREGRLSEVTAKLERDRQEMTDHVTGQPSFTAFHGSVADFTQFDPSMIGTGEGGGRLHGFYLSRTAEAAGGYRTTGMLNEANRGLAVARELLSKEPDRAAAIAAARKFADSDPRYAEALRALESGWNPGGYLYQLKVRADESRLLDLERPLADQPAGKIIEREFPDLPKGSGLEAYDELAARVGTQKASEQLVEAGIPGASYTNGDLVIFDSKLLNVVNKEGKTVAAAEVTPPAAVGDTLGSVGAAATETRKVELASSFGVSEATKFRNPMARLLTATSVWARRTAMDLADSPLLTREQLAGALSANGASLERSAILAINQATVAVGDKLDSLWKDLRFAGTEVPWFAKARSELGMLGQSSPELPTFSEFKAQVADAMRNGDAHAIPQVEEAAKFVRERVFDVWKERMLEQWKARGLSADDFIVKTADSYLQRIYDKQKIAAQRTNPEGTGFVDRVTNWLESDQATKAAAKERLTLYNAQLESFNKEIDKLEARFGRAEERAKALDIRAAERSRDDVPKTAGFGEAEPTGRVAQLQRRVATTKEEAKDLADVIDLMEGLVHQNPNLAEALARAEAKLERRNITERVERARHQEAGMAAKRSEKRLAALEEQLGKAEDRKALIEEYMVIADEFRAEIRGKIEKELGDWQGKSASAARSAIKAREKKIIETARDPQAARLTSADKAVDESVASIIESNRDLSRLELRERAQEITDQILGTPDGRLPYDVDMGGPEIGMVQPRGGEPPRGPMAKREFMIPDAMIADFLDNDIERVVRAHLRTMVPDLMLMERFGDVRMTERLKQIQDDYARAIDQATSEKERTALQKEKEAAIQDVAGIRDRLRGVYGQDAFNNMRMAGRIVASLKNLNVVESMGMAAVSSMSDMAGAIMRYGLNTTFRDAWQPFLSSMMSGGELKREARRQFRAMGIAIETTVASRHHGLNDTLEGYHPQSRLERTLQWGADRFQLVNGLAQWTDTMKVIASTVASQEIFRAAEAASKGTATARELRTLAENHIDVHNATKIAEEYAASGNIVDGVHLPNTEMWKNKNVRDLFEAAVGREADIAVVSPGQEKPLTMSDPVLSIFTQFKSFIASSTERTLVANLQRRDAQVLQGVIASMALGMVSYKINSMLGGQATSDRPQDWVKEGLSRGGALGWFEEANAMASKLTRGQADMYRLIGADKPLSRYAGRTVLDQVLGPTAGKIEALTKVTGAAATLIPGATVDWNASDTTAMRKLIAGQNVWWLRGAFNQAEAAFNQAFGIQPKQ